MNYLQRYKNLYLIFFHVILFLMMYLNCNKNITNMRQVDCSILSWISENESVMFLLMYFFLLRETLEAYLIIPGFMISKHSFFTPPELLFYYKLKSKFYIKYNCIYFPFSLSSNSLG